MSGRALPTGLAAALAAPVVYPVLLLELAWSTGAIYLWNGYHALVWNGITWQPTGQLGGVSAIKESADQSANGVQVSLSGIPSALIAEALDNASQGRPARLYFGVLENVGAFVIDPYLVFDGLIDYTNINDDGDTSSITIALEKEFVDNRSDARRWTHEDQQIDYPGDLGFQYVAALANKQFTWGKATVFASTGAGSGSSDGELPIE